MYGFTIVELLIVIVVIAILAAITSVAYKGITQRANNTATEDVASTYRRALIQYAIEKGTYPSTISSCLGDGYTDGCFNGNVDAAFNETLKSYIGNLPTPPQHCHYMYGMCRREIAFSRQDIHLDGIAHTWSISYMLDGAGARCGADGQAGGTWTNAKSTPNASGYIETYSGTTLCRLILPDPSKV